MKEVVAERFLQEAPTLTPLPTPRFDTAYRERRHVAWDGYIEVRGNRYSVPSEFVGEMVEIRIGLDSSVCIYAGEQLLTRHQLRPAQEGWVTVPDHHTQLWQDALQVECRPLAVYEEVSSWN